MHKQIESLLRLAADTQQMLPLEDGLTAIIHEPGGDEYSVEELELVSAAAKPSYERFQALLNSRGSQYPGR